MVIKVLNLNKCISKFEDIAKVPLEKPIMKATQMVQKTAKEIAPKDTGYLMRSIRRETIGKGRNAYGRVWTTTEYAPYQEFGTSKMKAQPFLRPALGLHKYDIQNGIKEFIRTYLSNYKK